MPSCHMMKCGLFFTVERGKVEASESRKTETSNGGKAFSSHTLYPRRCFLDLRGLIYFYLIFIIFVNFLLCI